MNIKRNRIICAISVSIGPLIITIWQFIQSRGYYPVIMLIITIGLFIFSYMRTPKYYIKETDTGIIITGSKQGLYEPDFIAFDTIEDVKNIKNIYIKLSNSKVVEIYLPCKYREKYVQYLATKISKK